MSQESPPTPPAGPVVHEDGLVTFTVYLPGKSRVSLVGSFNNWDVEADRMEDVFGGLWTVEKRLPAGDHYYQYDVDGVRVCDPYGREVLYSQPRSPSDVPQAVLRLGPPLFGWQHDNWQRPLFGDLVIYEMNVADFTPNGTLAAAAERLDYIAGLGINAVEVMPVNEGSFKDEWGYQATYFFAVRGEYGTGDAFRAFVDAAHARSIAVILDIALAHTAPNHPFNMLYDFDKSPWYGHGIGGDNEFGLPTFDHRKDPTRAFCRDVQNFWLKDCHVDGLRYDYAKNIGVSGTDGVPYLAREARAARPDAYLIGEYLPEKPEFKPVSQLDSVWHVRFSYAIKAAVTRKAHWSYSLEDFTQCMSVLDPLKEGYGAPREIINYVESHDEARLIHELRDSGYGPREARDRLALAGTVLLTSPGVPMLYAGQEFGEDSHRSVNERNPLRWELVGTDGGAGLLEHYKRLTALRRAHPGLRAEGFQFDALDEAGKWVVYRRWNERGDVIVVAVNFSDDIRKTEVRLPYKGAWQDAVSGRGIEAGSDDQAIGVELKPLEAAVFVRV